MLKKINNLLKEKPKYYQQHLQAEWNQQFISQLLVLIKKKQIDVVLAHFNHLDSHQERVLNELIKLVMSMIQQNQLNQALALCQNILQQDIKNAELLHLTGLIYAMNKQYPKSIEYIQQAVKINPLSYPYINNLALSHLLFNQREIAMHYFEYATLLSDTEKEALQRYDGLVRTGITSNRTKIAYYTLDNLTFAISRLRVIDPLIYLQDNFTLLYGIKQFGKQLEIQLDILQHADLIVVQRGFPCAETQKFVDAILQSGKPIIYETDDLLTESSLTKEAFNHPQRPDYEKKSPFIKQFIQAATVVSVSTEFLQEQYSDLNDNIVVLPNLLNDVLWQFPEKDHTQQDKLIIGFAGSQGHMEDLRMIEDVLLAIYAKYRNKIAFSFIGCITDQLKALPYSTFTEANSQYVGWSTRLRNAKFDIAVVPLIDHPFNQCKSHIKWLEYSALGIPAIFSNLAEYKKNVIHLQTGLLVENNFDSWFTALEMLINDNLLAKRIGQTAKQFVMENYTLFKKGETQYLNFYQSLLS